jgi:beta-lactamase regulating signal transducer with metallopeptidase domain
MIPWHFRETRVAVDALGGALLHFVWQGALISGVLFVTLLLLRRQSPAARYVAACIGLAVLALCPVATFTFLATQTAKRPSPVTMTLPAPVQVTAPSQPSGSVLAATTRETAARSTRIEPVIHEELGVLSTVSRRPQLHLTESTLQRIVWLWLVGVVLLSLRLCAGLLGLVRLRRRGARPVPDEVQTRFAQLAHRMGLRAAVRLMESRCVAVPTVIGGLKSVILVPASVLTGLPSPQIDAIIAHELAHIRRHDSLVNLIQVVIETVLFYHPAIWWVSHRIRVEREHCCDDLAVAALGDRVTYAKALTALEEMCGVSAPMALAATGGDLLARIRYVLGRRNTTFSPTPATTVGVASMLLCTALSVVAFRPAPAVPHRIAMLRQIPLASPAHVTGALETEVPAFVDDVVHLSLAGLHGLVQIDDSTTETPRSSDVQDRASDPGQRPQSHDRSGAEASASSQSDDRTAPGSNPGHDRSTSQTDPTASARQDGHAPDSHVQPGGSATGAQDPAPSQDEAEHSAADADRQTARRDRQAEDEDSRSLDALDRRIEALGQEMEGRELTARERADLSARMAELGSRLGALIGRKARRDVDMALQHGLGNSQSEIRRQIDRAMRQAKAAVDQAMRQTNTAAEVGRALRDAHIQEQVDRALRDAHIDERLHRALDHVHIEESVRRAMRRADVDAQLHRALSNAHVDEAVRQALQSAHVGDQVRRALQDAQIQIDRALREADHEMQRHDRDNDPADRSHRDPASPPDSDSNDN